MGPSLENSSEGLEQEILALESRLPPAITQNESSIDSLRLKQKDMEIIMQQQQQTIYNLREENHLIKSRLELIEN